MKNFAVKTLPSLMVIATLAACGAAEKKTEIVNKEEKPPHASSGSSGFKLRPIREVQLENGLRILFITDNTLPRVSMTMLVKVGARQDPQGKEGLNNLAAQLLEQGTQSKNAMVVADELGQLGTEISIEPSSDYTILAMDALVNSSDKLLNLYSDIVINPAFLDSEVARAKSQTIAHQQKKIDNPSSFADDAFDEFLFKGHPYANDVTGTPASVKKITKQDIIRHYLNNYRPNNAQLAVVGRFDKAFESKVGEAFKKWTGKPIRDFTTPELKPIEGLEVKLVSKAGLQQAQIRIGEFGIRRNDPDFLTLRLANVALGGEFGSRLNQRVRDDLGLTYSIYSYFDSRADRGPFVINTFTKNETIGKTLEESLKVFTDFVEKGLTEAELKASKEQMLGQFPRAIETADRLAYNILILNYYGVPLSYLQDFNKNVAALSLSEVNDAIKKHLDVKKLRVLVYADEKKVGNQLKEYKPIVEKVK
jgi:zinc protease